MSAVATSAVVVCIDFRNPKAYLAKAPTQALEDVVGVRFDWQPLEIRMPSHPAPVRDGDDRGTRHRSMRAQYNERDMRRYAARAGLQLGDIYRAPDARVANMGLLWCAPHGADATRRYVDAVFESYWDERLDLADPAAIEALLVRADTPTLKWREFVEGPGRDALAQAQQVLAQAGAFDVPAYLIEGDVYLGRHHLPMLHWILTGRVGQPPL